jgi:hypothetical protein
LGDIAGFEELLRRDVARISFAGLDILPIYSTDGVSATLAEELGGARAWAAVCREFRDAANGRCRGMLYSGWDTDMGAEWGNGYNGFLATAWYGWLLETQARMTVMPQSAGADSGGAGPFSDADGDGVLDALRIMAPGPLAHDPPEDPAAAKAVQKPAANAGAAAAKTPGQP